MPATTPATMRRVCGVVERAEAQRVQQRDRPRAHREDVADDAADAGRRALIGLDERRVVVRLDLEDGGQAVADVDGAGVLARALHDARAGGRQRLQVDARALVAAVLRPHHREHAELGQVRLAAEQLPDAVVLVRGDAVAFERGGVEGHRVWTSVTERSAGNGADHARWPGAGSRKNADERAPRRCRASVIGGSALGTAAQSFQNARAEARTSTTAEHHRATRPTTRLD